MQPVIIGDATLYLGDCLEILPLVGNVQHVITDPPYEKEAHTKGRRLSGKKTGRARTLEYGELDFGSITDEIRRNVSSLCVKASDGWFIAFCQAEAVQAWREAHEHGGAKYKRACVWIKPDGAPQFTGDRPGMGYESIVASWCGQGRSKWNGGGRHGVFHHPHRDNNFPKEHMTQKPIALMVELIQLFTASEDIVLDPFMGSATTGVAAIQLGRKFIGIERDERYFEVACKRIERAVSQGQLFAQERPKQVQEQLL